MPEKSHWPFGPDGGEGAARESDRSLEKQREREAQKLQMAAQAEVQRQSRNNRLIVGGKAHTRKKGLS
ncbi:MAG: hypothetical protein HGB10_06170 [Coriobacteriia bacterium]|nr:hypothetical protein [Coriobacteriia bacterium]